MSTIDRHLVVGFLWGVLYGAGIVAISWNRHEVEERQQARLIAPKPSTAIDLPNNCYLEMPHMARICTGPNNYFARGY